jgi:hypothetical protein
MSTREETPAIVRWTRALEDTSALDGPVHALEGPVEKIFATGTRGEVLRGDWLGHALHPVLTDVVIGSWTSATVLDLVGDKDSATSARRLIGVGLLAFGPTAWAGWAEWSNAGPREKRVGLVHVLVNGAAFASYVASYRARGRGRRAAGAGWALAGATVSGVGAYLGGHLVAARKVGSRHPAYDETAGSTS